jgi:hypothetical protein
MNHKQMWLMWIGVAIVCMLLLFPPWKFVVPGYNGAIYEKVGPYQMVTNPPTFVGEGNWSAEVDWERMFGPLIVVILLDAGGMVAFRRK